MRISSVVIVIALIFVGCASPPPDRQQKLLAMASNESQQITVPRERLRTELILANDQIGLGQNTEAQKSLSHAAQTLSDAKPDDLEPRIRIAGWVSISELSRKINDKQSAETACDQALAVLHALQPVEERPEYVVSVSHEVRELRGKPAAAKLLAESAEWTTQIKNVVIRHAALLSICDEIFVCEDYDAGLAALRTDPDPAWRTDSLRELANAAGVQDPTKWRAYAAVPQSSIDQAHASYGTSVDFESVFSRGK